VESVGEHVEGFAAGDTVVPTFLGQCSHCGSCTSEHSNVCDSVPFIIGPGMRRDGTTRFWDAQGSPLYRSFIDINIWNSCYIAHSNIV
jgi:S-(hydroxymethyl)glutathione dehydrogenase/alcohol dehydrogenase